MAVLSEQDVLDPLAVYDHALDLDAAAQPCGNSAKAA
jgi:hypothetical protein